MSFILGKKISLSRVFDNKGNVVPVTLIEAGPCFVVQIKREEKDGYTAVQIGFGKAKKIKKPQQMHFRKAKLGNFKYLREFRIPLNQVKTFKLGEKIDVSVFREGDLVKVSGFSKGRGFAGVMKRHGFRGSPASHGHKHDHRAPGSIGSAFPEHVFKGMRMAGRMGRDKVTIKNLEIVKIDKENNLLAVKGACPGARGELLKIETVS